MIEQITKGDLAEILLHACQHFRPLGTDKIRRMAIESYIEKLRPYMNIIDEDAGSILTNYFNKDAYDRED